MKKRLLGHLDDEQFFKRCDQLENAMEEALTNVLNSWVDEGVIDENGKKIMLEAWSDGRHDVFDELLG